MIKNTIKESVNVEYGDKTVSYMYDLEDLYKWNEDVTITFAKSQLKFASIIFFSFFSSYLL